MSLEGTIKELREIAAGARQLTDVFKSLAAAGKEASASKTAKIQRLVDRLDTAARSGARKRREREIEQLTTVIDAYRLTLTVTGLSRATRETIEADLTRKLSRRTRLRNLQATDFGGVLSAAEARDLVELVRKAKAEVRAKKLAVSFLDSLLKIADVTLSLAGRFAL
jgi:hypothetical protein